MSKFDAIFNEIRSSEKNICEPVNLVHATQFFINVFFFGNIGHICELFIGAIIKGFQ